MRDFVNKYRNLSIVNKKMNSQIPQKEQRDEFKTMQIFSKLKLSYLICFYQFDDIEKFRFSPRFR